MRLPDELRLRHTDAADLPRIAELREAVGRSAVPRRDETIYGNAVGALG